MNALYNGSQILVGAVDEISVVNRYRIVKHHLLTPPVQKPRMLQIKPCRLVQPLLVRFCLDGTGNIADGPLAHSLGGNTAAVVVQLYGFGNSAGGVFNIIGNAGNAVCRQPIQIRSCSFGISVKVSLAYGESEGSLL